MFIDLGRNTPHCFENYNCTPGGLGSTKPGIHILFNDFGFE